MSPATTGVDQVDAAVIWCGAVVAMAGALALVWRATRSLRRIAGKVEDFVDDWQGIEARPGVPARPGVMLRLGAIEDRLARVEHELHPNSGASLRDAVDRVDQRTRRIASDEDTLDTPRPRSPALGRRAGAPLSVTPRRQAHERAR